MVIESFWPQLYMFNNTDFTLYSLSDCYSEEARPIVISKHFDAQLIEIVQHYRQRTEQFKEKVIDPYASSPERSPPVSEYKSIHASAINDHHSSNNMNIWQDVTTWQDRCFVFVPAPVLRKDDYLKLVEERKRKEEEDKKRKEEEEKKKKEEAERKKKEEEEKKKKEEEEKKKADKPGEKKEEKKEEKKDDKADEEQKSIFPKMKCTFVDFLLKPIEDRMDKRLGSSIDPFTGDISKLTPECAS